MYGYFFNSLSSQELYDKIVKFIRRSITILVGF